MAMALDINWLGTWTLYKREVWRFMKVWNQTLLAPIITSLLFLAIFSLAMGEDKPVEGVPFLLFIAPGLIMMAIVQNAFANSSSSLMLAKIQGVIVDLLMPPLTAGELVFAFLLGSVTRGLLVGVTCFAAMEFFVPMQVAHPWLALYYVVVASLMMGLLGLLTGIWAYSFDQMAAITNYIVSPLAFLSGTFYSVDRLPGIWHDISHANPFFYMIDGFRYAITGHHDGNIGVGMVTLAVVSLVLWGACWFVWDRGYRLKS